eukprot:scaffold141833_cov18-Tisochrysis_lutea.AAC.1
MVGVAEGLALLLTASLFPWGKGASFPGAVSWPGRDAAPGGARAASGPCRDGKGKRTSARTAIWVCCSTETRQI